jgi:hypothetical protein
MSPEQARGLPHVDERTDIYSLGVILYEALAGRLPYQSEYVGDLILAIVVGGAPHLRELRPDLDPRIAEVVMKAMAHDPDARFQCARDMLSALASLDVGRGDLMRSDRPSEVGGGESPGLAFARELTLTESKVSTVVLEQARDSQRRRVMLTRAAIAATGAILTVLAFVWTGSERLPEVAAPPAPPVVDSVVPGASMAVPTAAPTTIVELSGLPSGAVVRLDGKPAGPRIELPRGATTHTLEVTSEGYEPWSRALTATADARIAVTLVPKAAVQPAPTVAPAKASPRPTRPARRKSRVITELDY